MDQSTRETATRGDSSNKTKTTRADKRGKTEREHKKNGIYEEGTDAFKRCVKNTLAG